MSLVIVGHCRVASDGPANTMKLADFDGPAADLSAGSDDRDEVDLAEARHPP
jgi:hypothetical protein